MIPVQPSVLVQRLAAVEQPLDLGLLGDERMQPLAGLGVLAVLQEARSAR
ncbi:MAG: hypothetical protein ACRDYA_09370 [Egibacteraceae bacterium]